MNMRWLIVLFAVLAHLSASSAYAASTGYLLVTKIRVHAEGSMRLYTNGNWPNPHGCGTPSQILLDGSATHYELLSAMIYDAYISEEPVNFFIDGCESIGSNEYPLIQGILLSKDASLE